MFSIFTLFATVGGIGGGGVTVPFAEIFFKLDPKPSIALSSFSILISTSSAGIFNVYQKHPEKPNQEIWETIHHFPKIIFIKGNPLCEEDLRKANVDFASYAIILGYF